MYCALYAMSKGLRVSTTAMMANRSLQLGGSHWHKILNLPIERNLSTHRRAELAILKLLQDPTKLDFIRTFKTLCCDEMRQVSSEMLATIDIIFRRIRNSEIYLGGILIICSMDCTQIQPVEGRPFLTSARIILCFKMVALAHSVRACEETFKRIQEIARYSNSKFHESPELVEEFVTKCSDHFTFVSNWDNDAITPSTFRLYSRRVLAKDAAKQFVDRVRRQIEERNRREKKAEM